MGEVQICISFLILSRLLGSEKYYQNSQEIFELYRHDCAKI